MGQEMLSGLSTAASRLHAAAGLPTCTSTAARRAAAFVSSGRACEKTRVSGAFAAKIAAAALSAPVNPVCDAPQNDIDQRVSN
jgi:hypothetical protein